MGARWASPTCASSCAGAPRSNPPARAGPGSSTCWPRAARTPAWRRWMPGAPAGRSRPGSARFASAACAPSRRAACPTAACACRSWRSGLLRLEYPELSAGGIGGVGGAVLGCDHHAAAFAHLLAVHRLQGAVVLEVRHRQLLAAARAGVDQPLRRQVVDVVHSLAGLDAALARSGLRIQREHAFGGASDEEQAALRV